MEKSMPTRDDLRAILANPGSTEKQVLQAKLVLTTRIANGNNAVRQVCEDYHLTSEESEKIVTQHGKIMGETEDKASKEAQRLEQLLEEMQEG